MLKNHKIKPGTLVMLTPVVEPFDPVVGLVLRQTYESSIPAYIVLADGNEYSLPETLLSEIIAEPQPAENFAP